MTTTTNEDAISNDAVESLNDGDFSRLDGLFEDGSGRSGKPGVVKWHQEGRFGGQPNVLAEASHMCQLPRAHPRD